MGHNKLPECLSSFKTQLSGLLRLTRQKLVTFQCRIVFFGTLLVHFFTSLFGKNHLKRNKIRAHLSMFEWTLHFQSKALNRYTHNILKCDLLSDIERLDGEKFLII